MDPHRYGQLMFGRETKIIQWGKDSLFQMLWTTGYPHTKKKKESQHRTHIELKMDHRSKCKTQEC
jgi:hypothetical protein